MHADIGKMAGYYQMMLNNKAPHIVMLWTALYLFISIGDTFKTVFKITDSMAKTSRKSLKNGPRIALNIFARNQLCYNGKETETTTRNFLAKPPTKTKQPETHLAFRRKLSLVSSGTKSPHTHVSSHNQIHETNDYDGLYNRAYKVE